VSGPERRPPPAWRDVLLVALGAALVWLMARTLL